MQVAEDFDLRPRAEAGPHIDPFRLSIAHAHDELDKQITDAISEYGRDARSGKNALNRGDVQAAMEAFDRIEARQIRR